MGHIGELIAKNSVITVNFGKRMLQGVTPANFARMPMGKGGAPIDTNHPAFAFGHACLYPAKALLSVGAPTQGLEPPAGWAELFEAGIDCKDDPTGSIYPAMDKVIGFFEMSYPEAGRRIAQIPDSVLQGQNHREGRPREMFPLAGQAAEFLLSGHTLFHLGQVSAWRRFMGLGAAG